MKKKPLLLLIFLAVLVSLFVPLKLPAKFESANVGSVILYNKSIVNRDDVDKVEVSVLDSELCDEMFKDCNPKLKLSVIEIDKSLSLYRYSEIRFVDGTVVPCGVYISGSFIRLLDSQKIIYLSEHGKDLLKSKLEGD